VILAIAIKNQSFGYAVASRRRTDVGNHLAEFLVLGHRAGRRSVAGVGNVATTSDRDERSFKLSVTGQTVSATEKLSATARNVGNKQFPTAHFVRGSAVKLVTDSRTISSNYRGNG
jgi:hypothetical protein